MSLFDEIANASLPSGEKADTGDLKSLARTERPGSNPGRAIAAQATPEVAAILKAADLAAEPMDLRFSSEQESGPAELTMPAYIYRAKRRKLTRIVMEEICDAIRKGTTDFVAGEAAGLTRDQFEHFMRTFKVFQLNVMQAKAQCQAQLEQAVARKKPLEHLLKGPSSRHKPDRPGWTAQTAITGADGGKVQHEVKHSVDLSRLTEAELIEMKKLVEKTEEKGEVIEGEFKEVDSKPE